MLKIEVEIEARDGRGRLIDKRRVSSDLVVKNLRRFLGYILQPDISDWDGYVDIGGTARRIQTWNQGDASGMYPYGKDLLGLDKIRMAVGTGTTAPTVDDYALEAQVASGTAPTKTVSWATDHTVAIYYAMSFTLTEAKDITESGLWFTMKDDANATRTIMLARDTFAAVSVPAGGTISVTYKITTTF